MLKLKSPIPTAVVLAVTCFWGSAALASAESTCGARPVAACASTSMGANDQVLSNETTVTTWAWPFKAAIVRTTPGRSGQHVGTLRLQTEEHYPEVYIVLRQRLVGTTMWAQVRIPGRTLSEGWVPRDDLADYARTTEEVVVDRNARTLRLFRAGRLIFAVPVAVGTTATPTPPGDYWIREGFVVNNDPPYGPYAFGTSAYSAVLTDWPHGGIIGIHGTDQPELVPGASSFGCVVLRNRDIERLSRLVAPGTPVHIR